MKQLLKKEFKLSASPLSYFFLAFAATVFIPGYPILVGAFFICFGLFQTFQASREANDILYSSMLPVKKTDLVKAKYYFTVIIQAAGFVLMAVFSVLRLLVLNGVQPYVSNPMMNANLAFLGFVLIIFACFNIFFVGGFFKTAYKVGIPFLIFGLLAFITIFLGESLHYFPMLGALNVDFHVSHIIVFALGAIFYAIGTIFSTIKSQKNFEKLDL